MGHVGAGRLLRTCFVFGHARDIHNRFIHPTCLIPRFDFRFAPRSCRGFRRRLGVGEVIRKNLEKVHVSHENRVVRVEQVLGIEIWGRGDLIAMWGRICSPGEDDPGDVLGIVV